MMAASQPGARLAAAMCFGVAGLLLREAEIDLSSKHVIGAAKQLKLVNDSMEESA